MVLGLNREQNASQSQGNFDVIRIRRQCYLFATNEELSLDTLYLILNFNLSV